MNTLVYEFSRRLHQKRAANTITGALYTQCDPDGNLYIMLDTIMDYQTNPNDAVSCSNQVNIVNGKKFVSCSTRGWELC